MYRKLCLASCVAALMALPLACSSGSPSPTSPTAAGIGSSGAFGPDNSTLKVTAPTPVSPVGAVEIEGYQPDLTASNAQGQYVAATGLSYRFQLFDEGNNVVFEGVASGGNGQTTAALPDELGDDKQYRWQVRAELGEHFGPWSTMATFKTAPIPTGPAPYGPTRNISPQEMLSILIRVHDELGFDLGSRSTRESRIEWLWTAVAVAHYGHRVLNPAGGDRNWCVKSGPDGRPPSDEVIVRCDTRDFWDTVGGAGADGYRLQLNYDGILPSNQPMYPPPLSSLPWNYGR